MNRNQLKTLNKWLAKQHRKPIVLRGARQVGKSTLVRLFSEQQNLPLAEINLERFPDLGPTFTQKDPIRLLNLLESLPNINSISENSILFLDEIQAVPEAIPMLRYFYEDMKNLPVVAAGSLLEFALSDHQFSMPVGRVEYLHMGPMTFTEFLDAINEAKLASIIRTFKTGDDLEKSTIRLSKLTGKISPSMSVREAWSEFSMYLTLLPALWVTRSSTVSFPVRIKVSQLKKILSFYVWHACCPKSYTAIVADCHYKRISKKKSTS